MKDYLTIIVWLAFVGLIFSQNKNLNSEEFSTYHSEVNNIQIDLTKNSINFSNNNSNIFSEDIVGIKNLQISTNNKFLLISNYAFPSDKSDYKITLELFNDEAEQIFKTEITAPFDLPHPLFALNNNGVIASFDPITFKLELITEDGEREINIENNIAPEMERTAFIQMNNESVYILTSINALSIEENESNVKLYKTNINNLNTSSSKINYSIPTLMKLIDDNLIVSGIKFQNSVPNGKTLKLDSELYTIASGDYAIEKIFMEHSPDSNNLYFAKYRNTIYTIDDNLSRIKNYYFDEGDRVADIAGSNNNLKVLIQKNNSFYLYNFTLDLAVKNFSELNLVSLSYPVLENVNGKLFLYTNGKTTILE